MITKRERPENDECDYTRTVDDPNGHVIPTE